MDGGVKFPVNHPDGLVPLFFITDPDCWDNCTKRIIKYPTAKRERQPMFEAINLILIRIKLNVHTLIYVIHICDANVFPLAGLTQFSAFLRPPFWPSWNDDQSALHFCFQASPNKLRIQCQLPEIFGVFLMTFTLPQFDLEAFVAATLAEDLGPTARDVTSESVIPADARFSGVMDSRDAIVVAGLPIAVAFFKHLDPAMEIEMLVEDGASVVAGTDLLRLSGNARAMLTAERSALNTVQHLSGIATMTRAYVEAIAGTGCTLLDTRKTIPGLRVLEKYATRMGGAINHRMGLWDAAMIKDNHVAVAGGVAEAVRCARAAGVERIILEVDSLAQIEPGLAAGATHLLLDNMDAPTLREAVSIVAGRVPTEASGGVTLQTIRAKAESGVTYISVGRLTQSAPAADIGLDFIVSS
jgi:nicotinate-nucleotide pyrophosphorylase (carboxylating)